MSLGANQLHPLEIADARDAAFKASEKQREVEDRMRDASRDLAEAERAYRKRLTKRILHLKADGTAITMCGEIARGETEVATLRYERDVKAGLLEAAKQEAFRRGADRKDVHQLITWSQHRDLRTDAEPVRDSEPIGAGRPRAVA